MPLDSDHEKEEDNLGSPRKPGLRDCLGRKGQSDFRLGVKSHALSSSLTKLERNMAANKVMPQASTG